MATYSELLQNENWKLKRNERLIIDEFKCQNCFNDKLISKFNFSAVSIGLRNKLTGKGLIFVVYDSEIETFYRINADKIISYDLFLTNIRLVAMINYYIYLKITDEITYFRPNN